MMLMAKTIGTLIDPKKKAEILKRIHERKAPFCAEKPEPEQPTTEKIKEEGKSEKKTKYKDWRKILKLDIAGQLKYMHLIIGARKGDVSKVQLALDRFEANINMVDENGETALTIAAREGHYDVVKYLLEKGASTKMSDKKGRTAFTLAVQAGHIDIANDIRDESIRRGVKLGKQMPVKKLAKKPRKKPIKSVNMQLMDAAKSGDLNAATRLVEGGAVVDATDRDDMTALMYAAQEGHAEIIGLLGKHGVHANKATGGGWTALMFAAEKGHLEAVKCLHEECKAEVFETNKEGKNAKELAEENGHKEVAEYLLYYMW